MSSVAPTIRVDNEVYEDLKGRAEPFVDTPNSVLRRLLGLETDRAGQEPRGMGGKVASRLRSGSLLNAREYRLPILRALEERGGSAHRSNVVEAVGELLRARFTDADRSLNRSGRVRWENRTMWVRSHLVAEGLLAEDSPRGVWELTEAGREYLRSRDGSED